MRDRLTWIGRCLFILGLMLALTPATQAQIDTGSIVGQVVDASGAVVPGATVTVVQEGTGLTVSTVTKGNGNYSVPNLRIGSYAVSAELQGFQRLTKRGLRLNIQRTLEVNFELEIGSMTEEVVVEGGAEVLQTQTADMGYAVDERQLVDLPLLGRRYAELALLQTGVVEAGQGISSRGEDTFFNANGNFATWNNYTLDGGDNNSFSTNLQERTPQVIQPPVDALGEFRIQTRTYSAEFGRSAGAVINASIKQGSNDIRGNVFGFFRDEALNANRWENERIDEPKGQYDQKIFGATLGGPIIPDQLFFFVDYQGNRTSQAQSQFATVPTSLMRTGDLSELPRALRATEYAPGCVAGQVILPSCIDPVAANLIGLYPMPNIASAQAAEGIPGGFISPNYFNDGVLDITINQFDVRLDTRLREGRDTLFVRYSRSDTSRNEPPVLGAIASGDWNSLIDVKAQSGVLGWSSVWGNSVFTEVRAAWNNIDGDTFHHGFGTATADTYGIQGVPIDPRYSGGFPATYISSFTRFGGPMWRPQFQESSVLQLSGNLAWNTGNHSFKFGFERRRDQVAYLDLRALNGAMMFSNGRYTNAGLGDFLLGLSSRQYLSLYHEADLYTDGWGVFAQDSWRPTENLTINYGLRYEYYSPMHDKNDILTNIDPASGEIFYATSSGDTFAQTLIHPDRNNFAPRVSFNWQASPRWVLKGGYGTFYQHTDRYGSEAQMALNPPQLVDLVIRADSVNDPPVFLLREGFQPISADDIDPTKVQWRIQDPNQDTPIVHQFSLGPEFQLSDNVTVSVEYVGNMVRNGRRLRNINQGMIQADGSVVFPYEQYGYGRAHLQQIGTNGRANYHALQTQLQKRFSDGLGFTASFTWSKAMADFLDHLSAGGGAGGNTPQNAHDMAADYGPTSFNVPKRLSLSFIYELPFGEGRNKQLEGIGGAILNDWNINGILSVADGRSFTVGASDQSGTGGGHTTRANCIGDPVPSGFTQTTDQWMDPAAFAEPADGTFGDCGHGTMQGPGRKSLNLSVFRSFPLGGERRLELRLEGFNVFNWANYAIPSSSISSPSSFGRIYQTIGTPREMQVAVKLYF